MSGALLACLLAAPAALGEPCAPTALVSGDPTVVAPIEQTLTLHGVATSTDGDCPVVRAEVAMLGTEVLTSIEDPDGRRSERVLATPFVAATVIESWARPDLSGGLLGPPVVRPAHTTPATGISGWSTGDTELRAEHEPSASSAADWSAWLGLAGETTAGGDQSVFFGPRVGVCWRLGPACVGALARFAYDSQLSGNSESLSTKRLALDGLLLLDFPFEWSSVSLVPGIGIGGGWARSSRYLEPEVEEEDDEEEEDWDRNEKSGQIDEDTFGLRVDLHLSLAIMLTEGLSLDLTVSGGLSALGHYGTYYYEPGRIAGEPRITGRAGVGLSYRF
jgi:hypothetical protein